MKFKKRVFKRRFKKRSFKKRRFFKKRRGMAYDGNLNIKVTT